MALTILEKIEIAKLSQAYAISDIAKSGLYGGGIDLSIARKIYCIRKNVEFLYNFIAAPLPTPQLFVSVVSSSEIDLNWTDVANATGFVLERATNSNFSVGLITLYTGALFAFADTGVSQNTTYYYRIKATATGFTDSDYGYASGMTPQVLILSETGYFLVTEDGNNIATE